MGWQEDAARAARTVGIDPALFVALVRQESSGNPGARNQKSGALGYTQLMPATAQGLGVDPRDPWQNLVGGARYLKQQLSAFGGNTRLALAAYNAGPGAVQKYGGVPPYAETQNYVKTILRAARSSSSPSGPAAPAPDVSALAAATQAPAPADPGPAQSNAALVSSLLAQQRPVASASSLPAPSFAAHPVLAGAVPQGGGGPAQRPDIGALIEASRTPGQAAADVAASASPLVASASSGPRSAPSTGTGGAQAALGWAESKVGFRETGTNSGGLASYLNQRFGMSNQPWCAMFTSAAVTKGGAPAAARTASVAEVRRQAQAGGGGYQKGFVSAGSAQPGDLILFGNDHIGMVRRVKGGKVFYVGGNQSDGVTEASVKVGGGDIVRPLYGRR